VSLLSKTDHLIFEIPAKSDYVGVIRLAISGIASRMEFTIEKIEDIKIAVSEACTNVVLYAYQDDENPGIHVDCAIHIDKLEISISDKGKGFDLDKLQNKQEVSQNELGASSLGLGITFMKNLMDSVEIVTSPGEGTNVIMTKLL